MTNEELTKHIASQQEQLAQLASLINKFGEASNLQGQAVLELQNQIIGYMAGFQVFAELVMAANPAVKDFIATATTQILARPETVENEPLQQMMQALQVTATSSPRTTPEGRRSHFQVIPGGEQSSEP